MILTDQEIEKIKGHPPITEDMPFKEINHYLMLEEAAKLRPPITRTGYITAIADVDKATRMVMIKCHDDYVYMMEDQLPSGFQKLTNKELNHRRIAFVPIGIEYNPGADDGFAIMVSFKAIDERLTVDMERKKILRGIVTEIVKDPQNNRFFSTVRCRGNYVYIEPKETTSTMEIGKIVRFVLIDHRNGHWYGSTHAAYAFHKSQLKKLYEEGSTIRAKVVRLEQYGAILEYKDDVLVTLRNKDFAEDYTPCRDKLQIGDSLLLKIVEFSETGKYIFVAPVTKYKDPEPFDTTTIEQGSVMDGEVISLSSFGAFVRIGPGTDVLCPIQFGKKEPCVGDKVKVSVEVRNPETGRVKGFIQSYVEDLPDLSEFDLM